MHGQQNIKCVRVLGSPAYWRQYSQPGETRFDNEPEGTAESSVIITAGIS